MAIGDDAANDGLDLVEPSDDRRQGWEEINRTRDYIALRIPKPSDGSWYARQEPGSIHTIGFYTLANGVLYFRPDPNTSQYDRQIMSSFDMALRDTLIGELADRVAALEQQAAQSASSTSTAEGGN